MTMFLFDLDGTITKEETLPIIAKHFHIEEEIEQLTKETLEGNIPFVESFIRRVHILGQLPVDEIEEVLSKVETNDAVINFIKKNRENCAIVTGNIHEWVSGILSKIDCDSYSSSAVIANNKVEKLTYILKKETIVSDYINKGKKVVFIGDSNNDVEAMRVANISIGCGITHQPAPSVFSVVDYIVYSEDSLCRLLNQLL